MAKQTKTNWHEKTGEELSKSLRETEAALLEAQVKRHSNQLTDTRMVSKLTDTIARIKTVMREKELAS